MSRLVGTVWISSRTDRPLNRLYVNSLASLPNYSTGLRGSLVSGVSTPMSLMVSGCSSCRTRITPGYSIRNGLAMAQDCHTGPVAQTGSRALLREAACTRHPRDKRVGVPKRGGARLYGARRMASKTWDVPVFHHE